MRRLHIGCHLEDHDLDGLDCFCGPTVYDIDDDGVIVTVVAHVDLS